MGDFDTDLNLAGSIDMVFKDENGDFWIYDWKRSKEIKNSNDFETGFEPLDHLPNANYWHYSLQLNIYKRILETKYDIHIKGMCLIVLHENHKNYMRYELPELAEEVYALFKERRHAFNTLCPLETLSEVLCGKAHEPSDVDVRSPAPGARA